MLEGGGGGVAITWSEQLNQSRRCQCEERSSPIYEQERKADAERHGMSFKGFPVWMAKCRVSAGGQRLRGWCRGDGGRG